MNLCMTFFDVVFYVDFFKRFFFFFFCGSCVLILLVLQAAWHIGSLVILF